MHSTVDFTWGQSIDRELSPKERMERQKEMQRREIGERSNELIAKRLRREVFVESELWKSAKVDEREKEIRRQPATINNNDRPKRSSSVYHTIDNSQAYSSNLPHIKDTLNQ